MNASLLVFPLITKLTGMACFSAAAGIYFLFSGLGTTLRRRSVKESPAADIRSARPGRIAVSGIAAGPYTLFGPLTGKDCYLYQTTVFQAEGNGRDPAWQKVAEETLHLPFFVEDSTGRLLIEPLGSELDLHEAFAGEYNVRLSARSTGNRDQDIPPRVTAFLLRHGIAAGLPTRVQERMIEPSTPVFVAGTLMENPGVQVRPYAPRAQKPDGDSTFRSARGAAAPPPAAEVIRLTSGQEPSSTAEMTQQQKIAAALNRAGISKPEAWAAAGVPFQAVALEEKPQAAIALDTSVEATWNAMRPDTGWPPTIDTPALVVMKEADEFLISSRSQKEVVGSMGWKSAAMVIGGLALTVLGGYVLSLEFSLR